MRSCCQSKATNVPTASCLHHHHHPSPMMKSMWQTPPLLSSHGSDQNPLHLGSKKMLPGLVNDHIDIAIAGISPIFNRSHTSSIRVHFPASYVRLPECIFLHDVNGSFLPKTPSFSIFGQRKKMGQSY